MAGHHRRRVAAVTGAAALLIAFAGCGSPEEAATGDSGPLKVGLVYSKTGALASYGKQYLEGFTAGLDYATRGTRKVGNRPVEVTEADDGGDPAKAVSAAKDLIGQGYQVLAGSTASGVAVQVAPLAAQNNVLFVSGPAATDAVTGVNANTFRSGRQTWQDIRTAASFLGSISGKKVTVFAQDSAFGQANVTAVETVLGGAGATVAKLLVPASATDLTPFASQVTGTRPDLLFVAWAGQTAQAMWTALGQQGVFDTTTVVTGLDIVATWPTYGPVGQRVSFLSHYFAGAAGTEVEKAMTERVTKAGGTVDLFTVDGFTAAQMVVRAASAADVPAMIKALEGWSFDGVKGRVTVRAEDHALLQPMYQVKLGGSATAPTATLVRTLDAEAVAPPVAAKK
jgi:branched-chain amino acid transport system substrate-binding protein